MKKVLKGIGIVLIVVICLVAGLLGYLTITEYQPAEREALSVEGAANKALHAGDTISVLTWNTGYGALGDNADFFMDGGKMVNTADQARVNENVDAILAGIRELTPDIALLQEVDVSSARSHSIDETKRYASSFPEMETTFAYNFKVPFIPYPMPPIGKVEGGIMTLSSFPVSEAERVQLPCPFSWPLRIANLKRCLAVHRIPIEGSDQELVLVNLHLEAYDDGEGKLAQTKMLREILQQEADAGNYVIAGGDFNQTFSNADISAYPAQEGKWASGIIDVTEFTDGWQFLMDPETPSCRSLDQPYVGADLETFQYYVIDGFLVSENMKVESLKTIQKNFAATDHNPVLLQVTLG